MIDFLRFARGLVTDFLRPRLEVFSENALLPDALRDAAIAS
jgi:hypothetical protein